MATYVCPKGHASHDGDYCDECGAAIAGVSQASMGTGTANAPASTAVSGSTAAAPTGAVCPECESPQAGRFCEVCGYDFIMAKIGGTGAAEAPAASAAQPVVEEPVEAEPVQAEPVVSSVESAAPVTASGWRLTVRSDAEYHARMDAQREPDTEAIPFPAFCPDRRFALTGTQALIGRRSRSRGIEPEIDLSGPPGDPAVSHAHALLVAQPDGSWSVVDLESANGTYVNDGADPIDSNTPIALADGDRVHVGSWTTITVQRG
jgi:FHA domain